MAYTPSTSFPANINIGQWQTPDAPKPRLANPITSTDTTINVTAPFKDKDDAVITGNFLFGIKNREGYVETVYAPAASVSADGLTITGAVRGVRLAGYDYTTGDADLASDHPQDAPVYANISALLFQMMIGAMTGAIGSGGLTWKVGDGTDGNVTVTAYNADVSKPFFQYNAATNQWVYSNDGVSSTPFGTGAGVTGGDGITVTAGDIDVDLTDTTVFVQTSSGAGDTGKVPRLNASGKLASGFIDTTATLQLAGTANETFASTGIAATFNGNTRLAKADADALNTTTPFAGLNTGTAASAGDSINYVPSGPVVTVPAFTVANRVSCRLWSGQSNSTSNTTSDTISSTTAWRAQTFTPSTGEDNVGAVIINITNSSLSATMQCAIYATSGGVPTGAALGTATALTSFASGDLTFTFATPVSVTPGTVYAVVVWLSAYGSGNFAWNYQNTNVYAGGQRCTSSDSGANWSAASTNDQRFTVQYRGISGEPVYISNTTGGLSLAPGTYNEIIGYAISSTEVCLNLQRPIVYGTAGFAASAAATVDSEITIGFRPRLVYWRIYNDVTPLAVAWGFAIQESTNFRNLIFGSQVSADTGSGASGTKVTGFNVAGLAEYNASGTNFYVSVFNVLSMSGDTVTFRRTVAGSSTTRNYTLDFIAYG